MGYTAHLDAFVREHLPPREQWPEFVFDLPSLQYPDRLNCATVLLDRAVERGWGPRTAIVAPGGLAWSYADLLGHANRIARGHRRGELDIHLERVGRPRVRRWI